MGNTKFVLWVLNHKFITSSSKCKFLETMKKNKLNALLIVLFGVMLSCEEPQNPKISNESAQSRQSPIENGVFSTQDIICNAAAWYVWDQNTNWISSYADIPFEVKTTTVWNSNDYIDANPNPVIKVRATAGTVYIYRLNGASLSPVVICNPGVDNYITIPGYSTCRKVNDQIAYKIPFSLAFYQFNGGAFQISLASVPSPHSIYTALPAYSHNLY